MDQRTRLLAALTLAWTVVWIERAALSPVGPLVQDDLGIGYAKLGLLPGLGVAAGAVGYLAAAAFAGRRPRATLLSGALLLALATLGSWLSRTYVQLAWSQAIAGVGEALFYVPALALVAETSPPASTGRALGILDSGISAGSFLVLLVGAPLAAAAGWRTVFLAGGALGLATLPFLWLALGPAPARGAAPRLAEVWTPRALPVYGAVMLLMSVYFSLLYLAPVFLVSRGFSLQGAGVVTALAVGLGIPWHIGGGALADRFGAARVALVFTLLATAGIVALAAPLASWALAAALVATYGLGIGAFVGLIALLPRIVGTALAAPAFGVFWALAYLGGASGPVAVGALADAFGFSPALLALGALSVLSALVLVPVVRAGANAR